MQGNDGSLEPVNDIIDEMTPVSTVRRTFSGIFPSAAAPSTAAPTQHKKTHPT